MYLKRDRAHKCVVQRHLGRARIAKQMPHAGAGEDFQKGMRAANRHNRLPIATAC